MISLTPFLLFDGHCAEAMSSYQSGLGGELKIVTVGETPMKERVAPEEHRKAAHAHLKNGAIEFSAIDWQHPTRRPTPGNTGARSSNAAPYAGRDDDVPQLAS